MMMHINKKKIKKIEKKKQSKAIKSLYIMKYFNILFNKLLEVNAVHLFFMLYKYKMCTALALYGTN